jgi:hypothetical protein
MENRTTIHMTPSVAAELRGYCARNGATQRDVIEAGIMHVIKGQASIGFDVTCPSCGAELKATADGMVVDATPGNGAGGATQLAPLELQALELVRRALAAGGAAHVSAAFEVLRLPLPRA